MPVTQETWVQSLGWEDLLEEGMATTPVFLPEESHEQRSLVGYSPQGCKESEITEQLSTHSQGEMSPCPSCRGVQGFTAQPVRQVLWRP